MKRNRILFFSGNRAEFGYLLPFLIELDALHEIDFIISGTHLLPPWNTSVEIQESIRKHDLRVNLINIEIPNIPNAHINSFALIHQKTVDILKEKSYDYAFVLGDRPESFAFASAVFLHNTPLIHYAGGDVTDNAYLDSNIRHVITKMAHLHLTLSEDSKDVVEQLGEEAWRVRNVGISTYDYDRLGLLPTKEEIEAKFPTFDFTQKTLIVTYHATQYKTPNANYEDFKNLLEILNEFSLNTILTYPNNDTGSEKIIEFLENSTFEKNIALVKNLGTLTMLSLYKNFDTIVVGNSSSGLLETCLYKTPTLNIGDRQGNRKKANNVLDVNLDKNEIKENLTFILKNYEAIKRECENKKGIFGFGDSTKILREIIEDTSLTKEMLMFKRFIKSVSSFS
ncbi:MAG: UDP-N-acetylglucosamine 2-epimerase [Sulfurimonas sp.]|jgi:GDP/UDP-N,N'-diacetylbacillosamine 2-epimerase (hydrolysing)